MNLKKIDPKIKLGSFFDPIFTIGLNDIYVFKVFIDGKWVSFNSGETLDVTSPIDNRVIAKVQSTNSKEAEETVDVAYKNKEKIREISAIERIEIFERAKKIMLDHKDEFVNTLVLEAGKPVKDAEGEVEATAERMEMTMEEARKIFGEYIPGDWSKDTRGKIALVIREPVGVVAAISPFNYPLYISSAKVIPALLSGNAAVCKPPSDDPVSLLLLARVLEAAGIPAGTLNVVTGSGHVVGDALVSNEKVEMVSFTGSTETGKHIAQLASAKKQHLELGGKGVAVVLEDADLNFAAKKCVEGSLKNAGQRCDAVSAILVVESVADPFVEMVVREVDQWKLGDPREPTTRVGPVINERAVKKVHSLVEDAVEKGAKLLRGGHFKGCYYEPTVLDRVPLEARIAWEETFGPVVTIIRVKDENEALEIANKPRYGLDSCVFSNDFYKIWKIAKKMQTGGITVNDAPRHGVGYFPFGGTKGSGIGREGIGYSIEEMTYMKTLVFNLEPAKLGKTRSHA